MTELKTIGQLLDRPLDQKIEAIVRVNQMDEATVYTEISEYVATAGIESGYRRILHAVAAGPTDPPQDVGIWVSGFFGSGKSSFAKILGYVLANPTVKGHHASDLFQARVPNQELSDLVTNINNKLPMNVMMFDVMNDAAVQTKNEKIAEIVYRVLLRELDYAQDFIVADLEITLEDEGRLERFIELCAETHGDWRKVRAGGLRLNQASAVLHKLDPESFPNADSWSNAMQGKQPPITIDLLVKRAFELHARRRPGEAFAFVIDEVGQYVAGSREKLEDLRALVEQFGRVGHNRVLANLAPGPAWIVVTSQEKLEGIADYVIVNKDAFAKIEARFPREYRVDMQPEDIKEVTSKRVLTKTRDAILILQKLFDDNQGILTASSALENSGIDCRIDRSEFVTTYPYLPHLIDLSIDVSSGLRQQSDNALLMSGSNRAIIWQAHQLLVGKRAHLKDEPVGRLVTLDMIYDLVDSHISSDRRKDVADIRRLVEDESDTSWDVRVAKALTLLQLVRKVPRTEKNIAAVLLDAVGQPAPLGEVAEALDRLIDRQFVARNEEGYRLLSTEEKSWVEERSGHLKPKIKDKRATAAAILRETLEDARLTTVRYQNLRTFKLAVALNGDPIAQGAIPFDVQTLDPGENLDEKVATVVAVSLSPDDKNQFYWRFCLTDEIDRMLAELYASGQMAAKYDLISAQGMIKAEQATLLQEEKQRMLRTQRQLKAKLDQALVAGRIIFRGIPKDASSYGAGPAEIATTVVGDNILKLFENLPLGAYLVKSSDPLGLLTTNDLASAPSVAQAGNGGIGLVKQQGGQFTIDIQCEAAEEVLNYVTTHSDYEKVTGSILQGHFTSFRYGWEPSVLTLILAGLLRASAIKVDYQGHTYSDGTALGVRPVFDSTVAFKSATFATSRAVASPTDLVTAKETLDRLTGISVPIEEAAIVMAAKAWASDQLTALNLDIAAAAAHKLPGVDSLNAYQSELRSLTAPEPGSVMTALSGPNHGDIEATRKAAETVRLLLGQDNLKAIELARRCMQVLAPALGDGAAEDAVELRALVDGENVYTQLPQISLLSKRIYEAYRSAYVAAHEQRREQFSAAIELIRGTPEWLAAAGSAPPEALNTALNPLRSRICVDKSQLESTLADPSDECPMCHNSLEAIQLQLASLNASRAQALTAIINLGPADGSEIRVQRIAAASLFPDPLQSTEDVKRAVDRVKEHLLDLVSSSTVILE